MFWYFRNHFLWYTFPFGQGITKLARNASFSPLGWTLTDGAKVAPDLGNRVTETPKVGLKLKIIARSIWWAHFWANHSRKSQQWKIILMIFPLCVLCIFLAILSFIPCVLLYRNNAAFDLDITHALEASLLQSSIFWGEWVKIFKRCAGYHTFGVLVLCPDYSWPWSPPASANHISFGPTKYKIS